MPEQLRIDERRRARIRACQAHAPAALRIQAHDADGKAMPKREREGVRIAARRLEHDLHIGARELRQRADEAGGLEHVARQRPRPEQRVLEQVRQRRAAPRATRCRTSRVLRHLHAEPPTAR